MGQVNVTVAGKNYRMACGDGEEKHLLALAGQVDAKIAELRAAFGEIGDMRLHVMAAIYFADELADMKTRIEKLETRVGAVQSDAQADADAMRAEMSRVAAALDGMAGRIENAAREISNR